MLKVSNNIIKMTKGDSAVFNVDIAFADGTPYIIKSGSTFMNGLPPFLPSIRNSQGRVYGVFVTRRSRLGSIPLFFIAKIVSLSLSGRLHIQSLPPKFSRNAAAEQISSSLHSTSCLAISSAGATLFMPLSAALYGGFIVTTSIEA